jgi:acyl-CoA thioesterase YciA
MSYIDLAGATCVASMTRQKFVTVAMKEVIFKEPVRVGEVVSFYATRTRVGRTSISVHVDVEVERYHKHPVPVTSADLTFVCVDQSGHPEPVVEIRD